jgi:hypothetical protein
MKNGLRISRSPERPFLAFFSVYLTGCSSFDGVGFCIWEGYFYRLSKFIVVNKNLGFGFHEVTKLANLQFGPYLNHQKEVITSISSKAFLLVDASIEEEKPESNDYRVVVSSLLYNGMITSLTIRFLISWGLVIPAIALVRVRFEQTVVFSYLAWENPEKGLIPFITHVPIHEYLAAVKATSDKAISKYLKVDLEKLKDIASKFQKVTKPSFDNSLKFERKWTNLDLLSMIRKRDEIVNINDGSVLRSRLEKYYHSIYYEASSIIHTDCNSIFEFLNFKVDKNKLVIKQKSSWDEIVLLICADLDLLQTYEFLVFIGCKHHDYYYQELNDKLKKITRDVIVI